MTAAAENRLLPDYDSPRMLKKFLEANRLAMRKKFGQNFLVSPAARAKLLDALDISDGQSVWEVGPGLGAMTNGLLARGARVTAFEVDRGFLNVLALLFAPETAAGRLACVPGDVLKTWKPTLDAQGMPARFFGNLPYNIAATLIAGTVVAGIRFPLAVVTVQKEVACRMCAEPGSKAYSAFSVLCRWAYAVTPALNIARAGFYPQPSVDSCAVRLVPAANFPACSSPRRFIALVRALFASRRKTVRNNLLPFLDSAAATEAALAAAGIAPGSRAETLPVGVLLRLSDVCGEETHESAC
ncbi:16S rRNA (adenine(1518)-N(6)/adenine(1519)-N(6))-dimethyltransferase RsmA [Treponema endosymbiont of Eucomonympha sp.]|uniref:16S rRNA (adenine(1518)-N(6)/adenine(1519)-N(6))- dimethyltransferase RsmA n=1 Tax=Treponema endosymbiont of Eucomonympha sp. TaxID=1580831 RepID=UPI000B0BF5AA|nr:16S rRNA (adenine(1518)-N(6)/adenine(1519)-N(6))-dimethyltransferase RsmA [Treponema endosymbiont of Eucomonympha sp.]